MISGDAGLCSGREERSISDVLIGSTSQKVPGDRRSARAAAPFPDLPAEKSGIGWHACEHGRPWAILHWGVREGISSSCRRVLRSATLSETPTELTFMLLGILGIREGHLHGGTVRGGGIPLLLTRLPLRFPGSGTATEAQNLPVTCTKRVGCFSTVRHDTAPLSIADRFSVIRSMPYLNPSSGQSFLEAPLFLGKYISNL